MEDEYFFGRRVVRVNGTVVHSGRTVLSDHSGTYQFDLAGEPAFLKIRTNGLRYYYDLVTRPSVAESREGPRKELVQAPPSLTGSAVSVVLALAIATALAFLADGRLWREPAVALAGAPVDAIVTRTTTTTDEAYRIDYQFQVGSKSFRHSGFISKERYEHAVSLGVVPIRYLAVAPEVSAFAAEPGDLVFDILFGIGLAASAGWYLVSAARILGSYRVWSRLSKTGVDTAGRITGVRTLRNQYMVAVGCVFEYTYNADSGELRGQSGSFALDAPMHYPVGSAVRIRYDPDRPADSILLTPSA
ncbi:MAG: DUF3592 domain-containing protein [Chloroflexota bacterium]|nr:DUF3592 domain-containing protein [Chloroflexota bacterium]